MSERSAQCDQTADCITCSDAADVMRLDAIGSDGIGRCTDADGNGCEVMLALVPEARVGAELLVHAGVALLVAAPPATVEGGSASP